MKKLLLAALFCCFAFLLNSCSDKHNTKIGDIDCTINEITLTRTLELPDCLFGTVSYNTNGDNVLVIFQGDAKNTGNEPAYFITPVFKSSSDCTYEQEAHIHFKDSDNDILGVKLSPGESYKFIFFFSIPSSEVADGSLQFKKALISFNKDNTVLLPLSISSIKSVEDKLIIPDVTNL